MKTKVNWLLVCVLLCTIFQISSSVLTSNKHDVSKMLKLLEKIRSRISDELDTKQQEFEDWRSTLSSEVNSLHSNYETIKQELMEAEQAYYSKKQVQEEEVPVRENALSKKNAFIQSELSLILQIESYLKKLPHSVSLGEDCSHANSVCEAGTVCLDSVCQTADCGKIKRYDDSAETGVYKMKLDEKTEPMDVYCDMEVDGGGWTLVLNYLHRKYTNPNLQVMTHQLPISQQTTLGVDESSSTVSWGHLGPQMMSKLDIAELRFYCKTSSHNRIAHFKSSDPSVISYFKTGSGSGCSITNGWKSLSQHSAAMPQSIDHCWENKGSLAMTDFPYYKGGTNHWGVKGGGNRWECDDMIPSSLRSNPPHDTLHQIWIR